MFKCGLILLKKSLLHFQYFSSHNYAKPLPASPLADLPPDDKHGVAVARDVQEVGLRRPGLAGQVEHVQVGCARVSVVQA